VAELSYFRSVSDLVHGLAEPEDGEDEDTEGASDPIETWGLIAAVLGNAANRAAFQRSFWWHEDRSFRLYLKAAKGDSVVREIKDPATGQITERRTPCVVLSERPPSPEDAKARWRQARTRLWDLKREIDAELGALEEVWQLCLQLAEARSGSAQAEATLARLVARQATLQATKFHRLGDVETANGEFDRRAADLEQHRRTRPSLFARLFGSERWKVKGQ
jgi:hypothetical protein